jgi:hypothetical protein
MYRHKDLIMQKEAKFSVTAHERMCTYDTKILKELEVQYAEYAAGANCGSTTVAGGHARDIMPLNHLAWFDDIYRNHGTHF